MKSGHFFMGKKKLNLFSKLYIWYINFPKFKQSITTFMNSET